MTAPLFLLTCHRQGRGVYATHTGDDKGKYRKEKWGHTVLGCLIGRMPCYNKGSGRVSLVYVSSRVWKFSQNQGRRVAVDKREDSVLTA